MNYVFNERLSADFSNAKTAAATFLPAVAVGLLVVALFSSSTYSASGKRPYVFNKPAVHHSSPSQAASAATSNKAAAAAPAAGNSVANSSASSVPTPAPSALSTSTLAGRGGGGSITYPLSGGTTTNPLQTTITTPPVNLSTDGKQILSAPSTSITVN